MVPLRPLARKSHFGIVMAFVIGAALLLPARAFAEECSMASLLEHAQAANGCPNQSCDRARATSWLSQANAKRKECPAREVGRFFKHPAVRSLVACFEPENRRKCFRPEKRAGGEGTPVVDVGRPSVSTARLALAKDYAEIRVAMALSRCRRALKTCMTNLQVVGSYQVRKVREHDATVALRAVRAYMDLVVRSRDDEAVAEFADAVSLMGSVLMEVGPGDLQWLHEVASSFATLQLDPTDSRFQGLSRELKGILALPANDPVRKEKLVAYLADLARSGARGRQVRSEVEELSSAVRATRKLEAILGKSFARPILIDVEGVATEAPKGCPLRERVHQAAHARLTSPVDFGQRGGIKKKRADCPKGVCDVELRFRYGACAEPSLPQGSTCLSLGLLLSRSGKVFTVAGTGASSSAIAESPPIARCPSKDTISRLVDRVFDSLALAPRMLDAVYDLADTMPPEKLRVTPTQYRELSEVYEASMGLVPPAGGDFGFAEKIKRVFDQLKYQGVPGVSDYAEQVARLSWELSPDKSKFVVVLSEVGQGKKPKKVLELKMRGENLDRSPFGLAQATATWLIQYYEMERAARAATAPAHDAQAAFLQQNARDRAGPECQPSFDGRGYGLVLAGLPQVSDCDPTNDKAGRVLAVLDGGFLLTAGVAGYFGMAYRTDYSDERDTRSLNTSKVLFPIAGVALAGAIAMKVVGFFWPLSESDEKPLGPQLASPGKSTRWHPSTSPAFRY